MPPISTPSFHIPSDEEDRAINAGIAGDPDTFEVSDAQFAQMRPVKLGRPFAEQTKERITIRLSPEVLAAFRATGAGWQTRVDEALKQWLADHLT
ncbi:BrnA antitoxin family protein [Methylomonas sp. 2BW1-5-20]|uniref:BrnA antitoxin family protein n=1 Tax=Methylomonas sp. 2BW1-5-20 TaxID=3376686 RepID=UPI00404E9ADE